MLTHCDAAAARRMYPARSPCAHFRNHSSETSTAPLAQNNPIPLASHVQRSKSPHYQTLPLLPPPCTAPHELPPLPSHGSQLHGKTMTAARLLSAAFCPRKMPRTDCTQRCDTPGTHTPTHLHTYTPTHPRTHAISGGALDTSHSPRTFPSASAKHPPNLEPRSRLYGRNSRHQHCSISALT